MAELRIEVCSEEHLDILAAYNKQLIEDERHDNTMNMEQLKDRMRFFFTTGYKAYLFREGQAVLGYALVNHFKSPLYLRHFFIGREHRRQGHGRKAFGCLLRHLGTDTLDVEVMVWNRDGQAFWQSVGFKERSVYMRLEQDPPNT